MGENFNYDFRTPLQKQQDERKKNIIAMFADFRAKAPAETSDSRIMLAVSQHVGCTQQNVRVILIKAGDPLQAVHQVCLVSGVACGASLAYLANYIMKFKK